ncbi:MAG: transaldolase [Parachlamydiaceae bacterium]
MATQLEQLRKMTTIVIDTGDIQSIKQYHPTDATTNPSLILAAAKNPEYKHLIQGAIDYADQSNLSGEAKKELLMDKLFVNFGTEILKYVDGRVSTEVNARLSYDIEGSIHKARELIRLYEEAGVPRDRILIKLASTWEGAQAAKELEKEGIHCNMTLMFSLAQAIACADAKATLISPFVGRILDWYKKANNRDYTPQEDPGVLSVQQIYNYYKKLGIKTQVMGASFRNAGEILELAGCDLLTISPQFLNELNGSDAPIQKKLNAEEAKKMDIPAQKVDEKMFRWLMNENPMANEKLAEGIRKFAEDALTLEKLIAS